MLQVAPSVPAAKLAADVARIVALALQLPNHRDELSELLASYGGMVALRSDSARRPRHALYWRSGFVAVFPPFNANERQYVPLSEAKRMMRAA